MTTSTPPAAPTDRQRRILIGIGLALASLAICAGLIWAAQRLTAPAAEPATMSVEEAAQATLQAGAPPAATLTFKEQVATAVSATQATQGVAQPTEPPSVVEAPPAATVQPVGLPPQPQLRHPTQYVETGVGNTKSWSFNIAPDEVLIVGGWSVDGISGGIYKAWAGGQSVTMSVTDGFALVIAKDWAPDEFCFRLNQAKQYNWAHGTELPLPGWSACG